MGFKRVLKGDCDIDGECMDHTAFPAYFIFVPSSIWEEIKGEQWLRWNATDLSFFNLLIGGVV